MSIKRVAVAGGSISLPRNGRCVHCWEALFSNRFLLSVSVNQFGYKVVRNIYSTWTFYRANDIRVFFCVWQCSFFVFVVVGSIGVLVKALTKKVLQDIRLLHFLRKHPLTPTRPPPRFSCPAFLFCCQGPRAAVGATWSRGRDNACCFQRDPRYAQGLLD